MLRAPQIYGNRNFPIKNMFLNIFEPSQEAPRKLNFLPRKLPGSKKNS